MEERHLDHEARLAGGGLLALLAVSPFDASELFR